MFSDTARLCYGCGKPNHHPSKNSNPHDRHKKRQWVPTPVSLSSHIRNCEDQAKKDWESTSVPEPVLKAAIATRGLDAQGLVGFFLFLF